MIEKLLKKSNNFQFFRYSLIYSKLTKFRTKWSELTWHTLKLLLRASNSRGIYNVKLHTSRSQFLNYTTWTNTHHNISLIQVETDLITKHCQDLFNTACVWRNRLKTRMFLWQEKRNIWLVAQECIALLY